MELDLARVRRNVASATNEELLDRITVYRAGMEPLAIEIIETELVRRGIDDQAIQEHSARPAAVLICGGLPRRCARCDRPAVERRWGWHRLWSKLPVFPQPLYLCDVHRRD